MRRGGGVGRRPRIRKERRRLLIVTEGRVTEQQYFEGLIQHFRSSGAQIAGCTVRPGGGEPSLVLDCARDIVARSTSEFDEVWIVVDVDEHSKLESVLRECAAGGERAAVSNPSFEVWLLWHYDQIDRAQTSQTLARELAKHGFSRKKHIPTNFPFSRVGDAVEYASGGRRAVGVNQTGANPSCGLPHLVGKILDN